MSELTGEESTVTAGQLHKAVAETMRNVAAENERLRAFVAAQNDQLLAVNAEIETLRVTLAATRAELSGLLARMADSSRMTPSTIESDWEGSDEADYKSAEHGCS